MLLHIYQYTDKSTIMILKRLKMSIALHENPSQGCGSLTDVWDHNCYLPVVTQHIMP